MTSWILYWRIGLRRRRSRVSRCSTASSPPSVSTVTSGCGASAGSAARSGAGSADPSAASAGRSAASADPSADATGMSPSRCSSATSCAAWASAVSASTAGPSMRSRAISAACAGGSDQRLGSGSTAGGRSAAGAASTGSAAPNVSTGAASAAAGSLAASGATTSGAAVSSTFSARFCARRVLDVGAVDAAAPPRLVVFLGFGLQTLLLGDQPFAVGDRDLIVVGMDFREGQEAMAVAAIFHERRLQRRFDADDLGQIDVALEGLAGGGFEIEFFKSCSIDDDHPSLLGVARIDEHAPCHGLAPRRWVPTGASDRRPSRLCGARGTVRHRPVERPNIGQDGEASHCRTATGPADLGFPIATACLTVLPQTRRAQYPCVAPTRPGSETAVGALQPQRGKRFERRRLLARRNIRGSLASDNQNIASHELWPLNY